MEKKIAQYSYWLGLLCAVIAIGWRAANALGLFVTTYAPGVNFGYLSAYKGALILFLVTIATSAYVSVTGQKQ